MSAIGDFFMAMPHIDAILSHHSKDNVRILTSRLFKDFFSNHPRLKAVELDRGRWISKKSALGRILWIKKKKFDAIYDLQGNRTSRRFVRFSGAKIRVGTQPVDAYNFHPKLPYTNESRQNVADRLNETLCSAGLPPAGPGFDIYPSQRDKNMVNGWKTEQGLSDGQYMIMHAGSSRGWESKRWPADNYKKLGLMIEETGSRCVLAGSREDKDINRAISETVGIDATGVFSLMQLYLLGKNAKFAVTSDSAPMHIMAAAGASTYGFFGPTSWIKNHSAGQLQRVLKTDADCSPCFSGKCPPAKKHVCLDSIGPMDVFKKIDDELHIAP